MRARPSSALFLAFLLVLGLQLGASCNKPSLVLVVSSPAHGTFTTASSVVVSGNVNVSGVILTVNGEFVTVQPNNTWSTTVDLDPGIVFNPINVVAAKSSNGQTRRKRVVVIAGDSVPDGDFSLDSIALRLNDTGLDSVEPLVSDLVDLDIATLLPPGTVVIDNECVIDGGFLGCQGRATVTIENPPPSFSSFGLNVDSMTDFAAGDVTINDIRVDAYIDGGSWILVPNCGLRLTANSLLITGDYSLEPDAVDPTLIDVNLLSSPGVSFSGFNVEYTSGVCDLPIIGDIVQLIIGDVQPVVVNGLVGFLDDPDGGGPLDAPIADGIETALADIQIAGPIGEGLGLVLEAPLFAVLEDPDGITLGSDGRIQASFGTGPGQCVQPPGAPDLLASYHVDEPFPVFGPTTPLSGLPYGLGICISTSAFNQLLKAETECGLLQVDLTEIDFGVGLQPVTAGLLSLFIPELGSYDPATPMVIRIRPTLAPLLTGNVGPAGELAELRIGGLGIELWTNDGTNKRLLTGQADFRAGLDFSFDDLTSALVPAIGTVAAGDIAVAILNNPLTTDPLALADLLEDLLPTLLVDLAGALGSFPLPQFLGLDLQAVSVEQNGEFISLFADLVAAP